MWETVKNVKNGIWLKNLSICTMGLWVRSSEQECVKRLFHWWLNHNRSRATMSKVVGEIPLNRNGLLSARYGGDEEIVYSHVKA